MPRPLPQWLEPPPFEGAVHQLANNCSFPQYYDPFRGTTGTLRHAIPTSHSAVLVVTYRARGYPEPVVTWRREDGEEIVLKDSSGVKQLGKSGETVPFLVATATLSVS